MTLLGTCISNLPIRPPPNHHHANVHPISPSDHHQTITKTPPKHRHAHAYPISPSDHHQTTTTTTTTTTKPPKTPPKHYYHQENTKTRKWKKIPQINGKKFPKKIWTRPYSGMMVVNNPLARPYFLGGMALGGYPWIPMITQIDNLIGRF